MTVNNPDVLKLERLHGPLHAAVLERVLRLLTDGAWVVGAKLPSEEKLAEAIGVSRVTLRDALSLLEQDGLLERRHGVGTFVRQPPPVLQVQLDVNQSLTELMREGGLEPGSTEVELADAEAEASVAEALGVEPLSRVYVLERVHTANGMRVVYSKSFIRATLFPDPSPLVNLRGSLYALLREQLGIGTPSAVARLVPVTADSLLSRKLDVRIGCPLLLLEQIDSAPDNTPIILSRDYYVRRAVRFFVHRRSG
jgi:GntR family transcriptional regulator